MIEWIVWYGDGRSVTSAEAKPHEIPRWGVVCIVERSVAHGKIRHAALPVLGKDFFWWHGAGADDGHWINGDLWGLTDYLANTPGFYKVVLFGRGLPAESYHAICKRAIEDARLPDKTSSDWLEAPET